MTIEFALVMLPLCAILFGMLDAGRFVATRTMLAQAAAIGARTSCFGTATQAIVDQAVRDAAPGLSSITVDWVGSSCVAGGPGGCNWPRLAGDTVNLRVSYTFVAGFFTNFSKTMTNDSRLVCNN